MNELEKLLGMELPDEAKALLEKVKESYKKIEDANENFKNTIESKDRANSEAFEDRRRLREELAKTKEDAANGGNKDNSEQIEALKQAHESKYKELETQYNGLKTQVAEEKRINEFNALNIAAKLPKEWGENQVGVALRAIQREVLDGSVYDSESGTWGYDGALKYDSGTGNPLTIEGRAKALIESGAFDIYLAGQEGSGGGTPPSSNNGGGGPKKWGDYTPAELSQIRQDNPNEYERLKQTR